MDYCPDTNMQSCDIATLEVQAVYASPVERLETCGSMRDICVTLDWNTRTCSVILPKSRVINRNKILAKAEDSCEKAVKQTPT